MRFEVHHNDIWATCVSYTGSGQGKAWGSEALHDSLPCLLAEPQAEQST